MTAKAMAGNGSEHYEACALETDAWRRCVEANLADKAVQELCAADEAIFDACTGAWRRAVGPTVRVRGERQGEPPPQCAAMACLIERCLFETRFDHQQCALPSRFFKKCVKAFYTEEYVI